MWPGRGLVCALWDGRWKIHLCRSSALDSIEGVNLLRLRARLSERGIAVEFERAYTSTPPGGALRIAIFATHSFDQIDRLVEEIRQFVLK